MSEQLIPQEETLFIIKEIETNPTATQRVLSQRIGISLGKTNYLLKELTKKGFIEIKNLAAYPGKLPKINYILTKEGFNHKIQLIQHFLKVKEKEYNLLKDENQRLSVDKV